MVDFMLEFDDKKTCHFDKKTCRWIDAIFHQVLVCFIFDLVSYSTEPFFLGAFRATISIEAVSSLC